MVVFATTLQWDLWDTSSFTLFTLVHTFAVDICCSIGASLLAVIYVALKESVLS